MWWSNENECGTSSNGSSFIKERVPITKSSEDKRKYRGLELTNGLRVLLISDEGTDKSAASVNVGVGHLSDPWELPGVAHFCEHMLFLGTEKYPNENEYSKFIANNGGTTNAATYPDHTRYYFDIAPAHLKHALDILAQFFLSPQFTESATEREVNAVDSENKNNIKNDSRRIYQLEKSLSRPDHEFAKFGTGNRMTLLEDAKRNGIDTRKALLDFHRQYYSANIMTLCILGQETLDELENIVLELGYGTIANKDVTRQKWKVHPLGPEQLQQRVEVVPIKDIHILKLIFPIPDDRKEYTAQAATFLSHLVGHEGVGSIYAALKKRVWITKLVSSVGYPAAEFATFNVDMVLTEDAVEHVEKIIELFFSYIGMLARSLDLEKSWEEMAQLQRLKFIFKDKERPVYYVHHIAHQMLEFPLTDALCAEYRCGSYDELLTSELLRKLHPRNLIYFILSSKFLGKQGFKREKWYGTEHRCFPFSETFLSMCEEAMKTPTEEMSLPQPNRYIPKDFSLQEKQDGIEHPVLIRDDEFTRVWHFLDTSYRLPKCCAYFWIGSPISYRSPVDFAYLYLMAECFKDIMAVQVYDATLSELRYVLNAESHGLELKVEGFNEKLPLFVSFLIESLVNLPPDERVFESQRKRYARKCRNFYSEQPYLQGLHYLKLVLRERKWTVEEMLKAANEVNLAGMVLFIQEFFMSFYVESLLHGNLKKEIAVELIESLVKCIWNCSGKCSPVPQKNLLKLREHRLPEGTVTVYKRSQRTHVNSALLTLLQTGPRSNRDNVMLSLISQMLAEPSFNILRTQEQLGYIVSCSPRRECGAQSLKIIVQGLKDPEFVIWRVENFLRHIREEIKGMPREEFNSHVESVATKRLEKPKKLKSLTDKYWKEVTDRAYQFERDINEVAIMRKFGKDEVLEFYDSFFGYAASQRKVLHILVKSDLCDGPPESEIEKEAAQFAELFGLSKNDLRPMTFISELAEFKVDLPLYELDKNEIDGCS